MDIQINAKYKIVSDPMNVVLQEFKQPKATEKILTPNPIGTTFPITQTLRKPVTI